MQTDDVLKINKICINFQYDMHMHHSYKNIIYAYNKLEFNYPEFQAVMTIMMKEAYENLGHRAFMKYVES